MDFFLQYMFSLEKYLLPQAIQANQFRLYISTGDLEENVFTLMRYKLRHLFSINR